ncbi:MAG: SnoaL-like domain-containing protein [Ferruginibacter sp.]
MNNLTEKLTDLNQLVLDGKMLEAFEKYYHDDVAMQENSNTATIGKEANRMREQIFLENITEFRGAAVLNMAAGDNVSFVEWKYDYTHKEWGMRNYTQVSKQQWKDGKIIHEQFFYGN